MGRPKKPVKKKIKRWKWQDDSILSLMMKAHENPLYISRIVGRPLWAVYSRASRLHLTRQYVDWGTDNVKYIIKQQLLGWSYTKIADSLGISAASVKQKFYTLRKSGELKKYIKEVKNEQSNIGR